MSLHGKYIRQLWGDFKPIWGSFVFQQFPTFLSLASLYSLGSCETLFTLTLCRLVKTLLQLLFEFSVTMLEQFPPFSIPVRLPVVEIAISDTLRLGIGLDF